MVSRSWLDVWMVCMCIKHITSAGLKCRGACGKSSVLESKCDCQAKATQVFWKNDFVDISIEYVTFDIRAFEK